MEPSPSAITRHLRDWGAGDTGALERLIPLVYAELRRMAARQFSREGGAHTLQPTALIHELYLRLAGQDRTRWQNRGQFFGVSAQLMRRILVDHARARRALKRGREAEVVPLTAGLLADEPRPVEVLALDGALEELAALDPEQVRLVELRYFAGLTIEETAEAMAISPATVKREWAAAKAWLWNRLRPR